MGQAKIRREAAARGEPDPMPQNRGLKSPGRVGMKVLEAKRHKWLRGGPPAAAAPAPVPASPPAILGRVRDRGREPKAKAAPVAAPEVAPTPEPAATEAVPAKKAPRKKAKPAE